MTWQSTAPDVIDALVTLWAGVGCDVIDGPQVGGSARREALMVGWNDADPEASGNGGVTQIDGMASLNERYAVTCTLRVRSGGAQSASWSTQRARAYALHTAALTALIEDDTRLGGVVLSATPGRWDLYAVNGQNGRDAALVFDVEINALAKWSP